MVYTTKVEREEEDNVGRRSGHYEGRNYFLCVATSLKEEIPPNRRSFPKLSAWQRISFVMQLLIVGA